MRRLSQMALRRLPRAPSAARPPPPKVPAVEEKPEPAPAGSAAEVARIERAYDRRDAAAEAAPYRYSSPAYTFYIQLVEWAVLDALRRAPIDFESADALEVGCGSGYFVNRLVEFGARSATGIDLMPGRIDAARRRYPAHRFECANAAELPLPDHSYDLVTQFTCLSSVLEANLRSEMAAEMWRVLRPGGAILSYDLREPTLPVRLMRGLGARTRGEANDDAATPTSGISEQQLALLFPQGELSYRATGLAFGLCRLAARSPMLARALAQLPPLREHAIALITKPPATGPG